MGREVKEGGVFKSPCGSRGDALMAGKTYTVEEKYNIIFESISTNQVITEICRKHGKSRKSPYEKQVEGLKSYVKISH